MSADPVIQNLDLPAFVSFSAEKPIMGPAIPGLDNGFIPQGLGRLDDGSFLISGYHFDGTNRTADKQKVGEVSVWVVPRSSAPHEVQITFTGAPFISHGCGVAVLDGMLFLAGGLDNTIYRGRWDPAATELEVEAFRTYPFSIDVVSAGPDGTLWAAQFYKRLQYGSRFIDLEDPNGITKFAVAAQLDPQDGTPRACIAIRQRVQGIAVTTHNLLLSTSWGQKPGSSELTLYKLPTAWPSSGRVTVEPWGRRPIWHVVENKGDKALQESSIPSMSQGLVVDEESIVWVLHESGASERFPNVTDRVTQLVGFRLNEPD